VLALLYGPAFASAAPAFRILALAFPLLSMNYALTHQLIVWNRQYAYAVICAMALGFNVLVNAWLIPSFAIEGAAWATLGTEAVLTAGCLVVLKRAS
jgi:O-antigen/teichoic acid export membrane protein